MKKVGVIARSSPGHFRCSHLESHNPTIGSWGPKTAFSATTSSFATDAPRAIAFLRTFARKLAGAE
jgi:hypothetical protein